MPPESARLLLREASLELARLRRVGGAYRTTWRRIARARARLAFAAALLGAALGAESAHAADPLFRHGFVLEATPAPGGISPALADLDGDGDLDLLSGDPSGNVLYFENTGTASAPSFATAVPPPFGLSDVGTYAAPTFADLDGDGDLDAFVGNAAGSTVFLQNTGTALAPAFASPSPDPFGLSDVGGYAAPTFGDLDGDGDLDALIGRATGHALFFRNTGSSTAPAFAAPSTSPFGLALIGTAATPELVDVDGDGDLDAFVGAYSGFYTTLFLNTGTASAPAFAASPASALGIGYANGFRLALAFGDVDGDGDLDGVVLSRNPSGLWVALSFENTGSAVAPAFSDAGNPFGLRFESSFTSMRNAAEFADIDGDGDPDAFLASNGTLRFFRNTGAAGAPAFAADTLPGGLAGHEPVFADIDADGDLDFFAAGGGSTLFQRNTGSVTSPAFAARSTNPFGLASVGLHYAAPSLVDIDGDGDLDAFIGAAYGSVVFFANTGSASAPAFAAPSSNPFGLSETGGRSPEFADLDGDGDYDALIGSSAPDAMFSRNTGSVTSPAFASPASSPFGLFPVAGWIGFLTPDIVDVDGDGDLDAFLGDYFSRLVFFENVLIDPDACTDGLDNDGDGRIDLASDAGCANAADTNELSALQCDNGLDDDADGKIDWRGDGSGDPHCSGLLDNREPPPPPGPGCGIGPELLLLGSLLAARRRRSAGS